MTNDEFRQLSRGDIVKSKTTKETYLIDSNYGDHVTACTTKDLTNPIEWELVLKANYVYDRDA